MKRRLCSLTDSLLGSVRAEINFIIDSCTVLYDVADSCYLTECSNQFMLITVDIEVTKSRGIIPGYNLFITSE